MCLAREPSGDFALGYDLTQFRQVCRKIDSPRWPVTRSPDVASMKPRPGMQSVKTRSTAWPVEYAGFQAQNAMREP